METNLLELNNENIRVMCLWDQIWESNLVKCWNVNLASSVSELLIIFSWFIKKRKNDYLMSNVGHSQDKEES